MKDYLKTALICTAILIGGVLSPWWSAWLFYAMSQVTTVLPMPPAQ